MREFSLDMIPGGAQTAVACNQYESGDTWVFALYYDGGRYSIPEDAEVSITGTKPDGAAYNISGTVVDNAVVIEVTEQMTACAGRSIAEILVESETDGTTLYSANFPLLVEPAAVQADLSPSEIPSAITGEDGTVYYSAKDGTIEQYIDDWMDNHPEVTTTVQDGAITEAKLANGAVTANKLASNSITTAKIADGALTEAKLSDALKLKTIKDYVTPEMFGAKGDGVTDDTTAIIDMFNNSGLIMFDPKKQYVVGETITPKSNTVIWNANLVFASQNVATTCFELQSVSNVRFYNTTIKSSNDKAGAVLSNEFLNWNNCQSSNLTAFFIKESQNVVIDTCVADNVARFCLCNNITTGYSDFIVFRNIHCKGLTYTAVSLQWVKNISISNAVFRWEELAYPRTHAIYLSRNCGNINIDKADIECSRYMSNILQFGNFAEDTYAQEDAISVVMTNSVVKGSTPIVFKHRVADIKFIDCTFIHAKQIIQSGGSETLTDGEYFCTFYKNGSSFNLDFDSCNFIVANEITGGIKFMQHLVTDTQKEKVRFKSCEFDNFTYIFVFFANNLDLTFDKCIVYFKERFLTAMRNEVYTDCKCLVNDCILHGVSGDGIISFGYDVKINITVKDTIADTTYYGVIIRNAYSTNVFKILSSYFYASASGASFVNNTNNTILGCYFNDVAVS